MRLRASLLPAAAAAALTALPAFAADTITIGNIVVAPGFLKSVGETAPTAFDIAVGEIDAAGGVNGEMPELARFDTGSDPKQAALGAGALIRDEGVAAILGPFSSGESRVGMPMAERAGVPTIPSAASAPGLTDGMEYSRRLTADEEKQFGRLL